MKGQAFITNELLGIKDKDLGDYGVTLIRGWKEALLKNLTPKSYVTNSSRLENGDRYAIPNKDAIRYKSREISLTFLLEGSSEEDYIEKLAAFQEVIVGSVKIRFPSLKNRTYTLVYLDCSKYGHYGNKRGNFVLKMTEPQPSIRPEE